MKLLLIDDCQSSQALIEGMLSTVCPGLDLSVEDDAVDFSAADVIGSYDCVLLDYRLPSMNGLELLAQARKAQVETPPVIMLSGERDLRVAVEAIKLGSCDFLPKQDLNAEQLGQAIATAVQQRQNKSTTRNQRQAQTVAAVAPLHHKQSRAFNAALQQQMAVSQEQDTGCAIVLLDTVFAPAFGAPLSDTESRALLRQSEQRLSAALRAGDSIHRIGPGRVAILLAGCSTETAVTAARARIERRLLGPYPLTSTRHASARTRIGVAVYPSDATNETDLVQHAINAMKQPACLCNDAVVSPVESTRSH